MRKLMCSQLEVNAASHVVVTQVFILISKIKDHLFQYFLPLIRRAASLPGGRATVINLADPLGSIEMSDGATARNATVYRMSKVRIPFPSSSFIPSSSQAALNMFTRALGIDLVKEKIIMVGLCPGRTKTEIGGDKTEFTVRNLISDLSYPFFLFRLKQQLSQWWMLFSIRSQSNTLHSFSIDILILSSSDSITSHLIVAHSHDKHWIIIFFIEKTHAIDWNRGKSEV